MANGLLSIGHGLIDILIGMWLPIHANRRAFLETAGYHLSFNFLVMLGHGTSGFRVPQNLGKTHMVLTCSNAVVIAGQREKIP